MRIVRFQAGGSVNWGIAEGGLIRTLKNDVLDHTQVLTKSLSLDGRIFRLKDVKLLAPCIPSKYVGIGINYYKTVEKKKLHIPERPIIFLKPSSSVIGPDEEIILPHPPAEVVHEGELAVVIGKKTKDVPEQKVHDYLLGYTCTNDVSDHSAFIKDGGNPTRAKSRDTFGPVGPWIETEISAEDLKVELYINGELRQSGRTSDLIFGVNKIVSFISSIMTLLPGDVIATGTPPGAAAMRPGDLVEVKVENIGTLRNVVVAPRSKDSSLGHNSSGEA